MTSCGAWADGMIPRQSGHAPIAGIYPAEFRKAFEGRAFKAGRHAAKWRLGGMPNYRLRLCNLDMLQSMTISLDPAAVDQHGTDCNQQRGQSTPFQLTKACSWQHKTMSPSHTNDVTDYIISVYLKILSTRRNGRIPSARANQSTKSGYYLASRQQLEPERGSADPFSPILAWSTSEQFFHSMRLLCSC